MFGIIRLFTVFAMLFLFSSSGFAGNPKTCNLDADCPQPQCSCLDFPTGKFCSGMLSESKDIDADCLLDIQDNCPNNYNPEQIDTDNDGKGDLCDNCPNYPNSEQADFDADGRGDDCDNCVWNSNADQADADGDGFGDACECNDQENNPYVSGGLDVCTSASTLNEVICSVSSGKAKKDAITISCSSNICSNGKCEMGSLPDQDNDGKTDNVDNCPTVSNPDQADSDEDGIGDVCDPDNEPIPEDVDNDGIPNVQDNCPWAANSNQKDSDNDGLGDACEEINGGEEGPFDGGGSGDCTYDTTNSVHLNTFSTINLYASIVAPYRYIVAGEGGNVVQKFADNGVWTKMPNPWSDTGIVPIAGLADRSITDMSVVSSEGMNLSVAATTAAGWLFQGNFTGQSGLTWKQEGPNGLGDKSPFARALFGVAKDGNSLWLVGADGAIWSKSRTWQKHEPFKSQAAQGDVYPYSKTIFRAVAAKDGVVWVVGDDGIVLKFADGVWQKITLPVSGGASNAGDLRTVWFDGSHTVIGGNSGKIFVSTNGATFAKETDLAGVAMIHKIAGENFNALYAVGTNSSIYKKSGSSWTAISIPYPNTIVGVYVSGDKVLASGVNGAIYSVKDGAVSVEQLRRKDVSDKEWTKTLWRSLDGEYVDFMLGGDDMAIVHVTSDDEGNAKSEEILFSDDAYVPFEKFKGGNKDVAAAQPKLSKFQTLASYFRNSIAKLKDAVGLGSKTELVNLSNAMFADSGRTINDIYFREDGVIYAVGKMPYVLKRLADGTIQKIMPSSQSGDPTEKTENKTIRLANNGSLVVAGNRGAYFIGSDDSVTMIDTAQFQKVQVADQFLPQLYIVGTNGAKYGLGQDSMFLLFSEPFSNIEQISVLKNTNDDASYAKVAFVGERDGRSYLNVTKSGEWAEFESPYPDDIKLLGVEPFYERIKRTYFGKEIKKTYHGSVVYGSKGAVAIRFNGQWQIIDTSNDDGTIPEDFYDGAHRKENHAGTSGGGWAQVQSWIVGVGGHNDILRTKFVVTCHF